MSKMMEIMRDGPLYKKVALVVTVTAGTGLIAYTGYRLWSDGPGFETLLSRLRGRRVSPSGEGRTGSASKQDQAEHDSKSSNKPAPKSRPEEDKSADKQGKAADKQDILVDKQGKPAEKQEKPADKQDILADKQGKPAEKQDKPADKQDKPAEKQDKPAEKQNKPADKQDISADKQGKPAEKQEFLKINERKDQSDTKPLNRSSDLDSEPTDSLNRSREAVRDSKEAAIKHTNKADVLHDVGKPSKGKLRQDGEDLSLKNSSAEKVLDKDVIRPEEKKNEAEEKRAEGLRIGAVSKPENATSAFHGSDHGTDQITRSKEALFDAKKGGSK